jgi:hypothetical protein
MKGEYRDAAKHTTIKNQSTPSEQESGTDGRLESWKDAVARIIT